MSGLDSLSEHGPALSGSFGARRLTIAGVALVVSYGTRPGFAQGAGPA